MTIIRPVQTNDLEKLYVLAKQAGHGLTTLPADRERLKAKIDASLAAFAKVTDKPEDEYYLFVLEDSTTGEVIGTSALEAALADTTLGDDDDEEGGEESKVKPQIYLLSNGEITPEFKIRFYILGVEASYLVNGKFDGELTTQASEL